MIRRGLKSIGWLEMVFSQAKLKKIQPYRYFLKYTFPPTSFAYLREGQKINHLLQQHIIKRLKKMDQMKQHYNRSVYDSMFKVHIALIYSLFENDSPLTLKALNLLENRLAYSTFDYKWSQVYEQYIIIRLINSLLPQQYQTQILRKMIISFLMFLQRENEQLQKDLTYITTSNTQQQVFDLFKSNTSKKEGYYYPINTFTLMDEEYMFTTNYNLKVYKKNKDPILLPRKLTWKDILHQKKDAALKIYQKEHTFYENTKISRLDYLCSVQFVLSHASTNQKFLNDFFHYLTVDWEKNQKKVMSVNRFLEVMVISKSLDHIIEINENKKYSSKGEQKRANSIKIGFFPKYIKIYIQYLSSITLEDLIELFTHPSNLFPKYLIIRTHSQFFTKKLKRVNLNILSMVFDNYNYGTLVLDRKVVFYYFQLLLLYFKETQTSKILPFIQKYEILILMNQKKCRLFQGPGWSSVFALMVKHNMKSDIIAQELFEYLQPRMFQQLLTKKHKISGLNLIQHLYLAYLYLKIFQVQTKQVQQIKKYFMENIACEEMYIYKKCINSEVIQTFEKSVDIEVVNHYSLRNTKDYMPLLEYFKNVIKLMKIILLAWDIEKERQNTVIVKDIINRHLEQLKKNFSDGQKIYKMASIPDLMKTFFEFMFIQEKWKLNDYKLVLNLIGQIVKQMKIFPKEKCEDSLDFIYNNSIQDIEVLDYGFFRDNQFNIHHISRVIDNHFIKDVLQKFNEKFNIQLELEQSSFGQQKKDEIQLITNVIKEIQFHLSQESLEKIQFPFLKILQEQFNGYHQIEHSLLKSARKKVNRSVPFFRNKPQSSEKLIQNQGEKETNDQKDKRKPMKNDKLLSSNSVEIIKNRRRRRNSLFPFKKDQTKDTNTEASIEKVQKINKQQDQIKNYEEITGKQTSLLPNQKEKKGKKERKKEKYPMKRIFQRSQTKQGEIKAENIDSKQQSSNSVVIKDKGSITMFPFKKDQTKSIIVQDNFDSNEQKVHNKQTKPQKETKN